MNVIKDGIVIDVTEKAFNVIYKEKGYVPYNAKNVKSKYEDLTKVEIISKLEEDGIEHNSKDLKPELLDLLRRED